MLFFFPLPTHPAHSTPLPCGSWADRHPQAGQQSWVQLPVLSSPSAGQRVMTSGDTLAGRTRDCKQSRQVSLPSGMESQAPRRAPSVHLGLLLPRCNLTFLGQGAGSLGNKIPGKLRIPAAALLAGCLNTSLRVRTCNMRLRKHFYLLGGWEDYFDLGTW